MLYKNRFIGITVSVLTIYKLALPEFSLSMDHVVYVPIYIRQKVESIIKKPNERTSLLYISSL